jgi:ribosomal protein S18 acetylase RimI-like enzyme
MRGAVVRVADAGDAEALWGLRLEALTSEPDAFAESAEEHRQTTVEGFAARLVGGTPDSFVVVACEDGAVVGMAGFFREPRAKRRHKGVVWGVYVRREARGRGIAREMLQEVVRRARGFEGLTQIHLSVRVGAEAARGLYASLGFGTFGIEPDSLRVEGRRIDQEHMFLPISD